MKVEGLVFVGTAAFFAVVAAVYWFTSYEEAGATMLVLLLAFGLVPGLWMLRWSRRMKPRPEDRPDADIASGAGPVGNFPGPTAWPVTLAAGAVLAANGIAFGIWPAVPGFVLIVLATCGAIASGRPRPR
ncbi:MAG TPA: cytochrome c oxidase subunit 4 [Acidimicrobiales bacterium]|nr:cytochrome c oxidase subunit 4 [Acidimicrobiales bacterium]